MRNLRTTLTVIGVFQLFFGVVFLVAPAAAAQALRLGPAAPPWATWLLAMMAARFLGFGYGMFAAARDPRGRVAWIDAMIAVQAVDWIATLAYLGAGTLSLAQVTTAAVAPPLSSPAWSRSTRAAGAAPGRPWARRDAAHLPGAVPAAGHPVGRPDDPGGAARDRHRTRRAGGRGRGGPRLRHWRARALPGRTGLGDDRRGLRRDRVDHRPAPRPRRPGHLAARRRDAARAGRSGRHARRRGTAAARRRLPARPVAGRPPELGGDSRPPGRAGADVLVRAAPPGRRGIGPAGIGGEEIAALLPRGSVPVGRDGGWFRFRAGGPAS